MLVIFGILLVGLWLGINGELKWLLVDVDLLSGGGGVMLIFELLLCMVFVVGMFIILSKLIVKFLCISLSVSWV